MLRNSGVRVNKKKDALPQYTFDFDQMTQVSFNANKPNRENN